MSYHILSIDSPECSLSCRDGQVTCRTGNEVKTVPLEDVASIIITSFSATLHSHLLLEAAKHGVALIICESFKPVSLVLPANRSTDTLLTRAQVDLPSIKKAAFWKKTIDAKCGNQLSLARELAPQHSDLTAMESMSRGKHPAKEAMCAKAFWNIFGDALGQPDFTRERDEGGINSLLNYGYAVLLSTILQKLFGVGLDPTFGVGHAIRERSTPLAYDLMEPFRSCVDWRVARWVQSQRSMDNSIAELTVTREFRAWVTAFPLEEVEYLGLTLDVRSVIEGTVRGFRKALVENNPAHYRPWTHSNSKWAGSS
jgi:CRISPR-associated protein Cas1